MTESIEVVTHKHALPRATLGLLGCWHSAFSLQCSFTPDPYPRSLPRSGPRPSTVLGIGTRVGSCRLYLADECQPHFSGCTRLCRETRATSMDLDFCLLRTMLGDIRGIAADLGTVQVSTVTNNEWHHFFGISLLYVGSIK